MINEIETGKGRFIVFKFDRFGNFEEAIEIENAIVNTGGALALDLIAGAGGTAFNNANAAVGIGDSSTATTATMTDLQAAVNKARVAVDATYPSRSGQTTTWQGTIPSGTGEWGASGIQEIGLFNNVAGGTMLARAVQNLGVKGVGTVWIIKYQRTLP